MGETIWNLDLGIFHIRADKDPLTLKGWKYEVTQNGRSFRDTIFASCFEVAKAIILSEIAVRDLCPWAVSQVEGSPDNLEEALRKIYGSVPLLDLLDQDFTVPLWGPEGTVGTQLEISMNGVQNIGGWKTAKERLSVEAWKEIEDEVLLGMAGLLCLSQDIPEDLKVKIAEYGIRGNQALCRSVYYEMAGPELN